MTNRVQQVRLTETGFAVDEQRVVRLRNLLGDSDCGCVGETIRRTDDERVEGVLRIQPGVVLGFRVCGGRFRRLGVGGVGDVVGFGLVDRGGMFGVDGDEHRHICADRLLEGLFDRRTEAGFEQVLREVVRDREDHLVLDGRERAGEAHERPVLGGQGGDALAAEDDVPGGGVHGSPLPQPRGGTTMSVLTQIHTLSTCVDRSATGP